MEGRVEINRVGDAMKACERLVLRTFVERLEECPPILVLLGTQTRIMNGRAGVNASSMSAGDGPPCCRTTASAVTPRPAPVDGAGH